MFTGIVETVGTIEDVTDSSDLRRFRISFDPPWTLPVGASVATAGVCLTVVDTSPGRLTVEAVPETLGRTSLGTWDTGRSVNLERAMPSDGRFDGHIVQGHVDGVGTVALVVAEGDGGRRLRVSADAGLLRYLVEKGSVTIDGVSLTVTGVGDGWFEVALIPHTLEVTTLGALDPGDPVNLEVDILAKYLERLLESRR